ncbi:hypothetical protein CspeluHIS016_0900360 [Cutaneotrichosporon spelunceum]|uniref:Aminoglycoside phosphotransferase domain-containing protein n=1 Tax=Cutaneotrichosporon spelunceum TaxID=1672016 RepID=A0AAD3TZM8_9TREE|nr:hypothetical protein CspeluHIS016_0900360 [Cutaneotrichosporon spelunceum]
MSLPERDGTAYGEVRSPLDKAKLVPYLEANVPGFKGPLDIKQFGFGQSNPTYLLETPSKSYVLRRAPSGKLLSSTAHRVDREYLILERINAWNSKLPASRAHLCVPVPEVYCLCEDRDVAGAPFYVMDYLKGRIFTDVMLPSLPRAERDEIWKGCVRALTLLHAVPVDELELPKSFAPDIKAKPYFPRQVKSMLKVSASQGAAPVPEYPGGVLGDIYGTPELVPYYESGAGRVAAADDSHGPSIVHGDYKLDNMIFHPTEARVIGILDWELCTVGSPLADLGNMTIPFNYPPLSVEEKAVISKSGSQQMGLGGLPSSETGIPTRDDLEAWWVEGINVAYAAHARTGTQWAYPIPNMPWVRSWMLFRLAIILQGIAARAALGQASSASATVTRSGMDFFGKVAIDAKNERQDSARL